MISGERVKPLFVCAIFTRLINFSDRSVTDSMWRYKPSENRGGGVGVVLVDGWYQVLDIGLALIQHLIHSTREGLSLDIGTHVIKYVTVNLRRRQFFILWVIGRHFYRAGHVTGTGPQTLPLQAPVWPLTAMSHLSVLASTQPPSATLAQCENNIRFILC